MFFGRVAIDHGDITSHGLTDVHGDVVDVDDESTTSTTSATSGTLTPQTPNGTEFYWPSKNISCEVDSNDGSALLTQAFCLTHRTTQVSARSRRTAP